jgi:hypothetical protein
MRHTFDDSDSHHRGLARWCTAPAGAEVRDAHTSARLGRWAAACLVVASGLTLAACGSTSRPKLSTTPTTPTINSSTNAARTVGATPATPAHNPGPAPSEPSFAKITGTYVAGTADGGWLYIRSDGASRFRAPDTTACPSCTTASAPIASLDFNLKSISSSGPGAYTATGAITATSDPAWASQLSRSATVGSPISLTVAPGGHLTLSLLPGNDLLTFSSPNPPSFPPAPTATTVACPLSASPGTTGTVPVIQVCSPQGAPHFETPQAAMTYLAGAWNAHNVPEIDYVTDPNGRAELDSMAAVMVNLRFKSCTPNPAGDYTCYFSHNIIPSTSPTTYPNPMNYPAGEAVFTVAPAQTPGWYLTNVIHCG